MQTANAVLIGASHFPKSRNIKAIPKVSASIKTIEKIIKENAVFGLNAESTVTLLDYQDNTLIKEQIFASSSRKADVFLLYYCGHIVLRKSELYIATPESSREMIYANGIALHELMAMLKESEAQNKVLIFDVQFINGDEEISETEQKEIESLLNIFADEISGCALITSAISAPYFAFNGGYEATLLTTAIAHCLKQGSKREVAELYLDDFFEEVRELLVSNGEASPFIAGKSRNPHLYVLPNFRYVEFERYLKTANAAFEQNKFSEAYISYNHCHILFAGNQFVSERIEFIKAFIEGEAKMEAKDYARAYEAFSRALNVIPNPLAKSNAIMALEKLADEAFQTGKFELAKTQYELLVQQTSDSERYSSQLARIDAELAFTALVDEGDRYYFENNYIKAAESYSKALAIKQDLRVSRRKVECDALIEKETLIRQKIEDEIRSEVLARYEQQFENEYLAKQEELLNNLRIKVRAEFEAEYAEMLNAEIAKHEREIEQLKQELSKDIAEAERLASEKRIEQAIQEIEQQLESRWEEKFETFTRQSEAEFAAKEANIRAELEKEFETRYLDMYSELEHRFWAALSLWNHKDGYEFYVDFFKDGKYLAKALRRIEELSQIQSVASAEQVEVEQHSERLQEGEPVVQTQPTHDKAESESETASSVIEAVENRESETDEKKPMPEIRFEVIERPRRKQVVPEPEPPQVNMTESELWEYALKGASVESFMFYIENSKEKKYIADAYYQINQIRRSGSVDYSISQPDNFSLRDSYTSDTIAQASDTQTTSPPLSKEQMAEDELWHRATSEHSIAAYYNYINNSKLKTYWNQAKEKIAELKQQSKAEEQAEWELAERLGTVEAYQNYIRKYPLGNYYAQAMFKINNLQSS